MEKTVVTIIGGGLAGTECALHLAEAGISVCLWEMRPHFSSPAHRTEKLAELVCSNSFGSFANHTASYQLKWEMEQLDSPLLKMAINTRVPAGHALGIDREAFSAAVTEAVQNHPLINIERRPLRNLTELTPPAVIATGPLTHPDLANQLQSCIGKDFFYFFDAIAPVIHADSIDYDTVWCADRWDRGSGDYLNCPLEKDEYFRLIEEINEARKIEPKEFEKDTPFFEGCMPIEVMAQRGPLTLRFGPMSPKGLTNPRTKKWPFAVVQLRQENINKTSYNMVGFQTKMAYPEQKRIFRLIPGLQEAEFLKLGSIHRNLYIDTPACLTPQLTLPDKKNIFFAGQIVGVEGYFESISIGALVSIFLRSELGLLKGNPLPPNSSALGSLYRSITESYGKKRLSPQNIHFGLFPPIVERLPREEKRQKILEKAKESHLEWIRQLGLSKQVIPGERTSIFHNMNQLLTLFLLFLSAFLYIPETPAKFQIPKNLSIKEQIQLTESIGLNTSSRLVTSPTPLGGFSGVDIGISLESFPIRDLSSMGDSVPDHKTSLVYPNLTLGKGLYLNFDVFLHITPYLAHQDFSQYGGSLRWTFYESPHQPVTVALLVHYNTVTVTNSMLARSTGAELVTGFHSGNLFLTANIGPVRTRTWFIGGPLGITNSMETHSHSASILKQSFSAGFELKPWYFILQAERFRDTVLIGKAGIRF